MAFEFLVNPQNEYRKNSVRFTNQINSLSELARRKSLGPEVTLSLSKLIREITNAPYGSGKIDIKSLRRVDKRVEYLLDKIGDDLNQKSLPLFLAHFKLLDQTLDSRVFAKEKLTDEQIRQAEILGEGMAKIVKCAEEKGQVEAEQAEIIKKASQCENDSQKTIYRAQWKELEIKRNKLEDKFAGYQKAHLSNVQVAENLRMEDFLADLPEKVMEPRDYEKKVSQIANKIAMRMDEYDQLDDISADASNVMSEALRSSNNAVSDDGFDTQVAIAKANSVSNSIDSAKYSQTKSNNSDDIKAPF